MTLHCPVTIWSPTSTANADARAYHLVTLAIPGRTEPGPLIGRITCHPDLGGAMSARVYPTHTPTVHTPVGVGFATVAAAAAAIGTAYDAARLVSLTAPSAAPGAERVTLIGYDDTTCPKRQTVLPGHVAVGDHLYCPPCLTHHVLTSAMRASAVSVTAIPAGDAQPVAVAR